MQCTCSDEQKAEMETAMPLIKMDCKHMLLPDKNLPECCPAAEMTSIYAENKMFFIERGASSGKGLAVLTSGGDSQGMNAALRACVRTAIYLGCDTYFIHEGYQGMVDGGDKIKSAKWASVSSIIHRGGTIIGSARCKEFREREGRLKAAHNLVQRGISNLVVIGGDGSLQGANLFHQEWSGLLNELLTNQKITQEERDNCAILHIVGLVGSIDNDFCGTDVTIGANTALHRIMEAIDAIISTAYSHKRTFIMEVMGRHCGYLGLASALATDADFLFIPEDPPADRWEDKLAKQLDEEHVAGKHWHIIILAEGAKDCRGDIISAESVKKVCVERCQMDTRITVLGHVQRGGLTSAFDRILACRMGAEAALALMQATAETEPIIIALEGNQTVRVNLMECVERTKAVAAAIAEKNWELAVKLRGVKFERSLRTYKMLVRADGAAKQKDGNDGLRLAVMHIGSPACGMNAAVRSFVRNAIYCGYEVCGIHDGIDGLLAGNVQQLHWSDVTGWVSQGGALLGTKLSMPEGKFAEIAARLKQFKIQGLLVIGGFDAFQACGQIYDQRKQYAEFCIPLVVLPSTISNNVPGTDFSLGCDTALNEITQVCDTIRQSAQGTKARVFIIETMGGYCGYLATLAGLAGGADAAYIYEEQFSVKDMQQDIFYMAAKMAEGCPRGLILRNERASHNYNIDFMHRLYAEEGKHLFSCRKNVIGHLQEGGSPSPFDRNIGTKMACACVNWFNEQFNANNACSINFISKESACLLGIAGSHYKFTALADLVYAAIFEKRLPKCQWWLKLRPLLKILGKHDSSPECEGMFVAVEDDCIDADAVF